MSQHSDGLCHPERSEGSVNTSRNNNADGIRFFAKAQNDKDSISKPSKSRVQQIGQPRFKAIRHIFLFIICVQSFYEGVSKCHHSIFQTRMTRITQINYNLPGSNDQDKSASSASKKSIPHEPEILNLKLIASTHQQSAGKPTALRHQASR